jgi:glycosyltransferase involved in cell wall biosynthesis
MEVYARELIPALLQRAPAGMRFTAFVNREAADSSSGAFRELIDTEVVPVSSRSRVQWVLGEQALLPRMARLAGVDLLHSLGSTAPGRGPFRRIVTIHDLIYARFPEAHSGLRGKGMRVLVPWAARRSHRVIADSQSTRQDLIALLSIPPGRIDVAPLGLGSPRCEQPLAEADVRARFDLDGRPILLSLSAKRPHKNLLALIDALAQISVERRPFVVVPGYPTWHEQELQRRADERGVSAELRLLPWLAAKDLEGLWALADGFVYPSLYEGFGLPVLEAMARGVPVASSNASSLPEVAGDAALLFDPRDERAIAQSMELLLRPQEAERLKALGLARARQFTWQRTADATIASYERALGEP